MTRRITARAVLFARLTPLFAVKRSSFYVGRSVARAPRKSRRREKSVLRIKAVLSRGDDDQPSLPPPLAVNLFRARPARPVVPPFPALRPLQLSRAGRTRLTRCQVARDLGSN